MSVNEKLQVEAIFFTPSAISANMDDNYIALSMKKTHFIVTHSDIQVLRIAHMKLNCIIMNQSTCIMPEFDIGRRFLK